MNSLCSIQILSDIHLEFWDECNSIKNLPPPLNDLPVSAPILALLGDIGIPSLPLYQDFISDVSKKFHLVLIISGNHEYYGGQIDEVDALIHSIAQKFSNVKYLQRTKLEYQDLVFLGTTLWTEIPLTPDIVYRQYKYFINDYRKIQLIDPTTQTRRLLDPKDTTAMHLRDKAWIEGELMEAQKQGKTAVVLTHHCPIGINTRCEKMRDEQNSIEYLDYTDLRELMRKFENILVWGFGHTHHSSSQIFGTTQIVSNCLGYVRNGEKDTNFDPKFFVDPFQSPLVETYRGHYQNLPVDPNVKKKLTTVGDIPNNKKYWQRKW
jgi:predicted phosphohydrolase